MHLVVHQVVQLEHVDEPDRDGLLEALAGPPVEQVALARFGQAGLLQDVADVLLAGAVEHRGDRLESQLGRRGAQMGLEDLPHIHAAGHAQRVEEDVNRCPIGEERHVFHGQDLRDDPLVAVAACHLVTDRDHTLGGDIDLHHLLHAVGKLVAPLQVVDEAVAFLDVEIDLLAVTVIDLLGLLAFGGGTQVQVVQAELGGLLGHGLVVLVGAQHLVAAGVLQGLHLQVLAEGLQHLAEELGDLFVGSFAVLLLETVNLLLLHVRHVGPAAEPLSGGDHALHARGNLQALVFHILAGAAEDGVQQLLLGGQLALGLGDHLADQDVTVVHMGAHADDARVV